MSILPKILVVESVDIFRSLMYFFNTQRQVDDSKALKISNKCEMFLEVILKQMSTSTITEGYGIANISVLIQEFKRKRISIMEEDLADSASAGFTGDLMVGEGNVVTCKVAYSKLKKALPAIRVMNAIKKINDTKASGGY